MENFRVEPAVRRIRVISSTSPSAPKDEERSKSRSKSKSRRAQGRARAIIRPSRSKKPGHLLHLSAVPIPSWTRRAIDTEREREGGGREREEKERRTTTMLKLIVSFVDWTNGGKIRSLLSGSLRYGRQGCELLTRQVERDFSYLPGTSQEEGRKLGGYHERNRNGIEGV